MSLYKNDHLFGDVCQYKGRLRVAVRPVIALHARLLPSRHQRFSTSHFVAGVFAIARRPR